MIFFFIFYFFPPSTTSGIINEEVEAFFFKQFYTHIFFSKKFDLNILKDKVASLQKMTTSKSINRSKVNILLIVGLKRPAFFSVTEGQVKLSHAPMV